MRPGPQHTLFLAVHQQESLWEAMVLAGLANAQSHCMILRQIPTKYRGLIMGHHGQT